MSCSDKPNPKQYDVNAVYNFENWAALIIQFIEKEVQRPCVLVCNSVGRLSDYDYDDDCIDRWVNGWISR